MFKHILVPVDGSDSAQRAVEHAASLARTYGARLVLLQVMVRIGSDQVPASLREVARTEHIEVTEARLLRSVAESIVEKAKDLAKAGGAEDVETAIEHGDPANTIVDYGTTHDIDLIVMGRRGLGQLAGLLMGSVSHKVAHHSTCACLTVP